MPDRDPALTRRRLHRVAAFVVIVMVAAACSSGDGPLTTASVSPHSLADSPGRIATAGADGFHLVRADSTRVASSDAGEIITQPTWSRDGKRVIVSVQGRGASTVRIMDGVNGEVLSSVESNRPYFFFSWNHDGTRVAALGPGLAGTTLDLLDSDGALIADSVADGGSVYVAWEPGGVDLLVHSDDNLSLVKPDLSVSTLGAVGRFFLAPSWIPGSREILVISPSPTNPHLVRLDVDARSDDPTADPIDDLGATGGIASVSVDPSGNLAVLLHARPGRAPVQGDTITTSYERTGAGTVLAIDRPVQDPTATVEMVDLANGERTPITGQTPLWGEWSPDGSNLLLATFDSTTREAVWSKWDGRGLTRLTGFLPTATFLQRYLVFADQYVEQPRLWAPDGTAFTYAARTDADDDAVFVMGLDRSVEPLEIDAASVGFWSPG